MADQKLTALTALAAFPADPANLLLYVVDLTEPLENDQSKKATLALIDTRYQPLDADLTTIAGLAKADGNFIVGDGAAWTVESGATARASLGLGTLAVINSPLPIINGGSGQVTQQTAIDALTNVAAATNEYVLTKDTATGNAIFKVTATVLPVVDETPLVYETGTPANTLTFDVTPYTAARVVTWPDAALTVAGLEVANVFTTLQTVTINDAITNAVTNTLTIDHNNTAGTPTTNFGTSLLFTGKSSTTSNRDMARIASSWSNATDANRSSYLVLSLVDNGAALAQAALFTPTGLGLGSITISDIQNRLVVGDTNKTLSHLQTTMHLSAFTTDAQGIDVGPGIGLAGYIDNAQTTRRNFGVIAGRKANATTGQARGYLSFSTLNTTLIEAMRIDNLQNCGIGITSPSTRLHTVADTATTNAVANVATIGVNVTGAGVGDVGFGPGLLLTAESSTTINTSQGRLTYEWATATHATRKARGKLTVFDTAEREAIRIEASGTAAMLGVLGAAAIARPAAYTLASTATRTMPTPEAAFTGIDNVQAGAVYAQVADLLTLQTRLNNVEGVLRQVIIDLASTSGFGFLAAA